MATKVVTYKQLQDDIRNRHNPWITDAAGVVYKNENVWADLSGLLVGDEAVFDDLARRGIVRCMVERIKQGIEFTDRPNKFLYGTDWPLAPMRVYRDFVRHMFPEEFHQAVFHDNAKALFRL
jgi:predicted TIM-barrel fold metal-dependent hydrolase